MRETWPQLSPELRKTAANIATIRLGVMAYVIILPASIVNTIATSTPAEFLAYLGRMTPLLGIIGLVAAIAILYVRAVRTSPRFLAEYLVIMPGFAERLEARYGEPGLGDVFAPWIRGRRNFVTAIIARIMSRMSLRP